MSIFQTLGNKLRSVDFHTLGNKMKSGAQTLARKAVKSMDTVENIGSKVLPVASHIGSALGLPGSGLLESAGKGLAKLHEFNNKAKMIRNSIHNL